VACEGHRLDYLEEWLVRGGGAVSGGDEVGGDPTDFEAESYEPGKVMFFATCSASRGPIFGRISLLLRD
jgi:hypothetical protein